MKSFAVLASILVGVSFLSVSASARDLDPQYKDEVVGAIYRVLQMKGAVTIDETAIETGANEWDIRIESIDLKGSTAQDVEASWKSFLASEKRKLTAKLREMYPEVVSAECLEVTDELSAKISQETDGKAFMNQGLDHQQTRAWLLSELLTKAGRMNTAFFLEGSSRKALEYFRFHFHDTSMEVVGEDMLVIRGVKKVLIVRISYVHS